MVLTTVGPLEACAELLEMNEALRTLKAGCNRKIIVLKNLSKHYKAKKKMNLNLEILQKIKGFHFFHSGWVLR